MRSSFSSVNLLLSSCIMAAVPASAWTWSALPVKGPAIPAPKVSGHASAATNDERIVLFGGLTGSAGSPTTDDLWVYDKGAGWKMIPSKEQGGTRPQRRMYAASAVLGDSFYLIGGWDPGEPGSGGTFLDDIWRLSLKTLKWDRVETSLPYPVSRHSACAVSSDTIAIHTHKGLLLLSSDGRDCSVSEQPTTGDGPDGLSMCGSASLGGDESGRMLIFGGSTRTQELSSAAYVLDTKSWTWTKLLSKQKGEEPRPIASPCATYAGDNECIVFGGATLGKDGYAGGLIPQDETWLCTVNKGTATVGWEKIASEDPSPEGRVAASLNAVGDEVILQGGWDPVSKETYDKTWVLKK